MLKKLTDKVRKARAKLSRAVTGLTLADRRIQHHKKLWHEFDMKLEAAQKQHGPAARQHVLENKRDHEKHMVRQWQEKQTKYHKRRLFLQTVLHRRLHKKRKWLETHADPGQPEDAHGLVWLDGHQVSKWIADILIAARNAGYWHGYIISGWRSPAYCEELCIHMCGRPSCSGTCAGRSSRHTGIEFPEGATDVSDSSGLERYCRAHGLPLYGNGYALPADLPHFSSDGH
jgi:hypothetical protein